MTYPISCKCSQFKLSPPPPPPSPLNKNTASNVNKTEDCGFISIYERNLLKEILLKYVCCNWITKPCFYGFLKSTLISNGNGCWKGANVNSIITASISINVKFSKVSKSPSKTFNMTQITRNVPPHLRFTAI